MKLRSFLLLKAVVAMGFGVVDGLAPGRSALWFGITLDPAGVYIARSFAAGFLGIGLLCLSTRRAEDSQLRRDVLLALLVADTGAFLAALSAQLSSVMNDLGWLVVIVWLSLVLGLLYFRFVSTDS